MVGLGAPLGELVPDLGAVVALVLAPYLVVVGEVFDGSFDGHVLRATRVSTDGHGVGLLFVTNGGRTRAVGRARASGTTAGTRARVRGTRAIIHVMGVVVGPFVGLASVAMATRAVVAILRRALLVSPVSAIVAMAIGAMVMPLTIRITIGAVLLAKTASSTASTGGIMVRAAASLAGPIAGVVGRSFLLFFPVGKSLDGAVLDIRSKVLREGGTNRV